MNIQTPMVNGSAPADVNGVKFDPLGLTKILNTVSNKSDALHSDSMNNMRSLSKLLGSIQSGKLAGGMGRISDGVYRGGAGPVMTMPYHGSKQVNKWVDTAIRLLGLNESYKPGILNMIQHESGGNPNSINNWDSNAKAGNPSQGLMQTIPSTFEAYRNKRLPNNIDDPIANLYAGLNYAEHRYGPGMIKAGGRHDANGNYIGY